MSVYEQTIATIKGSKPKKNMLYSEFSDYVIDDIDYSLARCFYYYLAGFDDRLPEYSYVDRVVDKIVSVNKDTGSFDSTISSAMGMVIMCKGSEDTRSLTIFQEEPISEKVIRNEIIEADRHSIYKVTPTTILPVDPDEVPIFKEDRVLAMQDYLRQYTEKKSHSVDVI